MDVQQAGGDRDVAVCVEPGAQRRLGSCPGPVGQALERPQAARGEVVGERRVCGEKQSEQVLLGARQRGRSQATLGMQRPGGHRTCDRPVRLLPGNRGTDDGAEAGERGCHLSRTPRSVGVGKQDHSHRVQRSADRG